MNATMSRACRMIKTLLTTMLTLALVLSWMPAGAQVGELTTIKLLEPDKKRGLLFMETLWVRASVREFSDKELSLQDLSSLLWAANGVNRPLEKKYTAPSAMNSHDVDVYVCLKDGIYLYDAEHHALNPVLEGDYRSEFMMTPSPRPKDASSSPPPPRPAPSISPIQVYLISDCSRFRVGTAELKYEWGALDAGIVSQNISLFCAATGLKTVPRASMDKARIRTVLKLKDTQFVFLNHPVGYAK
jgi:SagB-type dehydrogenase family enzyme